jgi:cytochrome c peroxidase
VTAVLHRRGVRIALLAGLVLAAGLTLWLVARDGEPAANPHANTLSRAEGARILQAVDAAAATQSNAELVAEGRRLFRSSDVAKSGESCQTCHVDASTNPSLGPIPHDGSDGITGPRDAPALWTVKDTPPYRWGGDIATLELMAADTVRNHFEGGASLNEDEVGERVAALVAYMRSLDPPTTDFDNGTMSAAARRGEELFQGKGGCIGCHGGPAFTDNEFHPLQRNPPLPPRDPGQPGSNPPAFNTPSLRDVANTAPYMHDGRLRTLAEVIDFYNRDSTVSPLNLTTAEQADLVAYLEALSR